MKIIYMRTNKENGKSYIGQTKDLKRRERDWRKFSTSYSSKELNEDRKKFGLDVWDLKILDYVEECDSDNAERYYIEKYNTMSPNGYNKYEGGVRGFNFTMKDETKEKISKTTKGKAKPESFKRKLKEYYKAHLKTTAKTVYQYTLDGKLIAIYPSAREASRQTGLSQMNISVCCNGGYFVKSRNKWVNRIQYNGYKWSYIPL